MDRRTLLGLFLAVPLILQVHKRTSEKRPISASTRAPKDTDDREYDEWLDEHDYVRGFDKDSMHLD